MTTKLDLLITNGRIIDGTGNPGYEADIGFVAGKIDIMGRDLNKMPANRMIDADGMVVCPGFIDTHSHDDAYLIINPQCDDKVRQGVTTDVIGNCGFSLAPLSDQHRDDSRKASAIMGGSHLPDDFWQLSSFEEFFTMLEDSRPGINVVPLVGHGTVRIAVLGFENIIISVSPHHEDYIGKSIAQIAKMEVKDPLTMIGTDGVPGFGNGKVHPRMIGTFPRILGR